MERLIKRYDSRKLYDTQDSRYVSLEELGDWIREGQQVRVVDNASGADVTAQTLTLVILEGGRKGSQLPPSEILHSLIRQGGDLVSSGVGQINKGVDRLLEAGAERLGPLRRMKDETASLRERLEELERTLARYEAGSRREARPETPAAAD